MDFLNFLNQTFPESVGNINEKSNLSWHSIIFLLKLFKQEIEKEKENLSFFKNSEEKEEYKKSIKEIYKKHPKKDNLCEIKELQIEIEKNIKQIEKMRIKQDVIFSCI